MCDSSKRVSVALELSEDLPPYPVLQRWLAEPIKAVVVSTGLFLTNKKGYPVLSRSHQGFLRSLFKVWKCAEIIRLVVGKLGLNACV
ncbi:hypothetical protein DPMN_126200 [Dreissena polymorpha]|uniref:PRMT5 TIM barrel domain-containing protein n=1 Tax=Dreissena polymorpha TaxID=45954 RepID=A0A9D4GWL0_DREPO|nr:hypothetical protein DPMN_126200 [Dreissena polymorpha]